jgi:hypothetical protein
MPDQDANSTAGRAMTPPGRHPPAVRCRITERTDHAGWYLAAEHAALDGPRQSGHLRAVPGTHPEADNASVICAPLPTAADAAAQAEHLACRFPGATITAATADDCCWLVMWATGRPAVRWPAHWRLWGALAGDPAVYASVALGFAMLYGPDLALLRPWVRIQVDGGPVRRLLVEPGSQVGDQVPCRTCTRTRS